MRDDTIGVLHPFADPATRVARIDHLFHLEPVQRADGTARAFDARIDFRPQRFRIGRLGELPLVGRLDAALGRDAANISRGPHHSGTRATAGRSEVIARDPKAAAHDDGENRHRDLREGNHPLAALANGACDLMLQANGESRIIDQVQQRNMEEVA